MKHQKPGENKALCKNAGLCVPGVTEYRMGHNNTTPSKKCEFPALMTISPHTLVYITLREQYRKINKAGIIKRINCQGLVEELNRE